MLRMRVYKHDGTVNPFIFLDAHRPWRKIKGTDGRAAVDCAACLRANQPTFYFPKSHANS